MIEQRTIEVTGTGSISLKPDLTRLTLGLDGIFKSYDEALRRSAEDTAKLKTAIAGAGFAEDAVKTLSFGVEPQYESVQDEKGNWKNVLAGYRFEHRMKLEFPVDSRTLSRVLAALGASGLDPACEISYTLADPESAKNQLLERAVQDAAAKARILAGAAGEELKELLHIRYSWGQQRFESAPLLRSKVAAAAAADYELSIEPDNICGSEEVTMIWRI